MFTGIIEKVATVLETQPIGPDANEGLKILVATDYPDLELGESIASNGVCLTVAEILSDGRALFFLSPETLARSSFSSIKAEDRVNLERAMKAHTRLSGHVVQGHVDGLGTLSAVRQQGDSRLLEVDIPSSLSRYCVEKGSIALNGVSLTINRIESLKTEENRARIHITLIPHSWSHTNFSSLKPGDAINVEVDVLAKYVEKLCHPYMKTL